MKYKITDNNNPDLIETDADACAEYNKIVVPRLAEICDDNDDADYINELTYSFWFDLLSKNHGNYDRIAEKTLEYLEGIK